MNLRCLDCDEDLVLRDKQIVRTNTRCKLRIEQSKATGKPIVIRGQCTQEYQPLFKHYYILTCDRCDIELIASESYKDITNYVIEYWKVTE